MSDEQGRAAGKIVYHWISKPRRFWPLGLCWFRAPDGRLVIVIGTPILSIPVRLPRLRHGS